MHFYYWGIIIIFIIVGLFLIQKFYANGYIGINKGPCPYCMSFSGVHYHYVSPTKYETRYNDHSSLKMCELCAKYPGQMHIHRNS